MNDNISLNIFPVIKILTGGDLPSFSSLLLKHARPKLLRLPTGQLLIQNICHYLVNIDFFEYDINQCTKIEVTVKSPSVVMVVMLNGHSQLHDEAGQLLKESHGNCCYLAYIAPGNYTRTFLTGNHQILLLTIPVEFLSEQVRRFKEIAPVLDSFYSDGSQYLTMSTAPIAKRIFKFLNKLNRDVHGTTFEKKIHHFLLECLDSYNNSLENSSIHDNLEKEKVNEIAAFLKKNYANNIVNDKIKLAAIFCISEGTMLRLVKKSFGKSLHQFIVELRLLYGLKQLMTTNKTVKEVAASVGYPDQYYFSRAFKQHFNISPSSIENLLPLKTLKY